jgi:hypothetical protein
LDKNPRRVSLKGRLGQNPLFLHFAVITIRSKIPENFIGRKTVDFLGQKSSLWTIFGVWWTNALLGDFQGRFSADFG